MEVKIEMYNGNKSQQQSRGESVMEVSNALIVQKKLGVGFHGLLKSQLTANPPRTKI